MRNILIVFTLLFSVSADAQVKKLNAETTIRNVTIFSSGARVERSSVVNIQPGEPKFHLPD